LPVKKERSKAPLFARGAKSGAPGNLHLLLVKEENSKARPFAQTTKVGAGHVKDWSVRPVAGGSGGVIISGATEEPLNAKGQRNGPAKEEHAPARNES
jgi:hypothetical protein